MQRGDDQSIQRFLRQGSRQAWQRLRSKQQRDNFTARRYGYVDEVLGLLAAARQRKQRLVGCDMNVALQAHARQQLRGTSSARHGDPLLRMRELHCWLALQRLLDGAPPVRHVAMLWGQGHIGPKAFVRLVPPTDEVISIYVLGQRLGPHGVENALPERFRPPKPLLVPIVGELEHQAVLLLPKTSVAISGGAAAPRFHDQDGSLPSRPGVIRLHSLPSAGKGRGTTWQRSVDQ